MNDFIKGLSVGIVLLILYILLQPSQNGRYVIWSDKQDVMLDSRTGKVFKGNSSDDPFVDRKLWKLVRYID